MDGQGQEFSGQQVGGAKDDRSQRRSVSPSAGVPIGWRFSTGVVSAVMRILVVVSAAMIRWLDVAVLIQRSQWPR